MNNQLISLNDIHLGSEHDPQEYTQPTKSELNDEFKSFLLVCGSCENFIFFAGEAGYCDKAENNCICVNPCAIIDMWDNKCHKWAIDPRILEETIKSKSGFSCPACEKSCAMDDSDIIAKTHEVFVFGDYRWIEVIECRRCNTIYQLENGT